MPDSPRELLTKLFHYIEEQLKEVDPRGYQISRATGFVRHPMDLQGLPGIELDLRSEGDHVWLRVPRLEAEKAPALPVGARGLISVSSDPNGAHPSQNEPAILKRINELTPATEQARRPEIESEIRTSVQNALQEYIRIWNAWAESEKPRRKTISLYGDLFSLKQQMETEETAKPVEVVWGIGVAAWQMSYEGRSFVFQYPLLTQAVEISLDEISMALDNRPRETDTPVELDGFIACSILGAADAERTARDRLSSEAGRVVSPFDPASYSPLLKMMAATLDSEGSYQELRSPDVALPEGGEHLVITDRWVMLSRPRAANYLVDDLNRLQNALREGSEIPPGPLALVSPPSDEPVVHEPVSFRGISSRGEGSRQSRELYFPLPYNSEQVTIVQRLERAPGVTVQGPPGTGKNTHNRQLIICHCLGYRFNAEYS